jgi:hypothetical protein
VRILPPGLARLIPAAVACVCLLAVIPASLRAQDGPVAIVVHPQVNVSGVSFDELKRIFRGDQQFWSDKSRITLLVRAPVAAERKLVLERIYGMSEDEFRQYWIAKMFRAEVAAGPKIVYSSEMARDLVTAIPGAITFMPAAAVLPGAKVLRIDNRLPNEAGYPLR